MGRPAVEALPETTWKALAHREAFPGDPSAEAGVEWLQTHLSHIYLTGERVYKFRKCVDLGFVHFETRIARNRDCLDEVALNRRLSPDVYLGVAPLLGEPDAPRIGAVAEDLSAPPSDEAPPGEHCVVMRRLARRDHALEKLARGELGPKQIDAMAALIADFHAHASRDVPDAASPEAWLAHCTRPVAANFEALDEAGPELAPQDLLERTRAAAGAFVAAHADRFEARRLAGRAIDGHGDLHLDHFYFEPSRPRPVVIDCLQFNAALRQVDAASDVAFTAMDLIYRGEPALAERLLRRYAEHGDDFDLYGVVDYFVSYRAAVRAKVAAFAARDSAIEEAQREAAAGSVRRHLALAAEAIEARAPAALILVMGLVGTGKSSVARALAERLGAVVISSDRVRKRLAGVAETERLSEGWDSGAYSPDSKARVYAALLERARPVLAAGRPVLLDATFSTRANRAEAAALARELGSACSLVEVRCAPETTKARIERRVAEDRDASDAGVAEYEKTAERFEPPDEWPAPIHHVVHTDRDGWAGDPLDAVARSLEPAS